MELIPLTVAREFGLKKYFTGTPCKHAHTAERHTKSGACVECEKIFRRKKSQQFRDSGKGRIYQREYVRRDYVKTKRRELSRKIANMPEPTRPCPELCECCGNPPKNRALCLDHDHTTNKFRGWLCTSCNSAIGRFGDNKEGVIKALIYLEKADGG